MAVFNHFDVVSSTSASQYLFFYPVIWASSFLTAYFKQTHAMGYFVPVNHSFSVFLANHSGSEEAIINRPTSRIDVHFQFVIVVSRF